MFGDVLHLLILGKCYAVHINASSLNKSVHRKKQHTRGNNTIPEKKLNFEVETYYALIATCDESPLIYLAPDVPEHSHFGICFIGTNTIRDCTTALFKVTVYRQFVRKVGTTANSALMRYYLLRL